MKINFFGTMYEWWQIILVGVAYAVPFGALIGVTYLTIKALDEAIGNDSRGGD